MLPILTLRTRAIVTMQFWFKKSFKIFVVLIVVWFVSIITLLKYPLPGFSNSVPSTLPMETTVMDGEVKFEETLRKMDNSNKDDKNTNKSPSAFGGKFVCKVAYFMFSFLSNNRTNNMKYFCS